MARQSVFVHGNVMTLEFPGGAGVVASPHTGGHQMDNVNGRPWSDIVGSRAENGVTFRGRRDQTNRFFAPLATPIWRDGTHAQLARVAVGYDADPGAQIEQIKAFDGHIVAWESRERLGLSGPQCDTWDLGTTFFNVEPARTVTKGIGISISVRFTADANIRFCWIGCELIV